MNLKRHKPLRAKRWGIARKKPADAKRNAPLRLSNPSRRRRLFRRNYGSRLRVAFVNSLPCLLSYRRECEGPIQNAHTRSRGAGGTYRDIVPLCAKHHAEQGGQLVAGGQKTFEKKYRINLAHEAQRIAGVVDHFLRWKDTDQ